MDKLNLVLDMGASLEVNHNISKLQYGDGYVQLATFGINPKRKIWSGTKTGDLAKTIKPIMVFLDSHIGKKFTWLDPLGETSAYICQGYSAPQRKGNFWQINLKLEQVF